MPDSREAGILAEHQQDAARLRRVGRLLLDRLEEALASAGPTGEERELGPGDLKSLARTHYEAAASLHKAIALERQALTMDDDGEGGGGVLPGLTILIDAEAADAGGRDEDA